MSTLWWTKRAIYGLSGVLLAFSTAWGQGSQPPPMANPAALQSQAEAEAVVQRDEAALGRSFDAEPRAAIVGALAALSPAERAGIPLGASPSIVGDSAADLVFTPVQPCRIISFAFIPANSQASFFAAGLCGIPFPGPTAVVMNMVAVAPGGSGDLRAFPFGSPVPGSSVINYAAIPGLNIANGLIVPICNPAVTTCGLDVTFQADVSGVTLVVDVYGYFRSPRPLSACVNSNATIGRAVGGTTGAIKISTGTYEVDFVRDITTCSCQLTVGLCGTSGSSGPGYATCVGRAGTPNGLFVTTFNPAGTLTDFAFYVDVICPLLPVAGP